MTTPFEPTGPAYWESLRSVVAMCRAAELGDVDAVVTLTANLSDAELNDALRTACGLVLGLLAWHQRSTGVTVGQWLDDVGRMAMLESTEP